MRKGDFCWLCHAGVFAYPMQIALKFDIPLIIWGEASGEYEAYFKLEDIENTDERKFNRRSVLGIRAEDMCGFIGEELRELSPYIYPPQKEINKAGIISVPLGNFIQWDVQKHVSIIKEDLGWEEDEVESAYPGLTYEKIECMFTGVRDYIKYIKRGFSRMTHLTTLDIRHGRITREEGMEMIRKYERKKPKSLSVFLEYMNMNEKEFNEIVLRHVIPPAQEIDPDSIPEGKELWDQYLWFKEDE